MTGWRIGYAAGPTEIIKAMVNIQSQTTSNTSSISQAGALAALSGTQEPLSMMKQEFEKRRDFVIQELNKIKRLEFVEPEGAFYVFVKTPISYSEKWCGELLKKEYVAVVPGEAFCYPGYFRMSYASSQDNLKEGIKRISKFLNNH
jgi:aspartate aminotransferase